MKIAYLISAHTDAPHLRRLVDSLDYYADFYIHVDKKTDIAPFQEGLERPNITFIAERHKVIWGDITQALYQQALLRAALKSGKEYCRLIMLSGLDYPLCSNKQIHQFFNRRSRQEFIQGICLRGQSSEFTKNYVIYRPQFWFDFLSDNFNLKLRKMARIFLFYSGKRKTLAFTVDGKKYTLHKGGDWWAITPNLASFLLKELDEHPAIMEYFKTSFAPSETLWQTLIFASPFARNAFLAEGEYQSLAALTPLHYIHYHPCIKVFSEEDYEFLLQTKKIFFRKCSTGKSDRLMDLLDAERERIDTHGGKHVFKLKIQNILWRIS